MNQSAGYIAFRRRIRNLLIAILSLAILFFIIQGPTPSDIIERAISRPWHFGLSAFLTLYYATSLPFLLSDS